MNDGSAKWLVSLFSLRVCYQTAPYSLSRKCFTFKSAKFRTAMVPNPLLGVFLHWLGGLASGSFYVPYRGVKGWSWETYWLTGGVVSWIVMPWLLAGLLTRD